MLETVIDKNVNLYAFDGDHFSSAVIEVVNIVVRTVVKHNVI